MFTQNLEIKTGQGTIYNRGQLDPRPLTTGPVATLESQAGLVKPGRWPGHARSRARLAGRRRPGKGGEAGWTGQRLTPRMKLGSVAAGRAGRRRIEGGGAPSAAGKKRPVAAVPGAPARFRAQGGRGRRGEAPQHLGGARGHR
jgi:hypothetical protein